MKSNPPPNPVPNIPPSSGDDLDDFTYVDVPPTRVLAPVSNPRQPHPYIMSCPFCLQHRSGIAPSPVRSFRRTTLGSPPSRLLSRTQTGRNVVLTGTDASARARARERFHRRKAAAMAGGASSLFHGDDHDGAASGNASFYRSGGGRSFLGESSFRGGYGWRLPG